MKDISCFQGAHSLVRELANQATVTEWYSKMQRCRVPSPPKGYKAEVSSQLSFEASGIVGQRERGTWKHSVSGEWRMAVTNHTSGKWQERWAGRTPWRTPITISTFCFSVSAKEFSFFPAETSVILGKVFHGLPQKSERRSGCDPNGNCSQPCKGRAPGTQRRAAGLIRRVPRA